MNRNYLLSLVMIGFTSMTHAQLSPEQTKITIKNASTQLIPYLRIKAKFADANGTTATGSLFVKDLVINESRTIDLKDAVTGDKQKNYKKTGLPKIKKAGLTINAVQELASVHVMRIKPFIDNETGYGSRAKFEGGTTLDSFTITDNPNAEYKTNKHGEQILRTFVIQPTSASN